MSIVYYFCFFCSLAVFSFSWPLPNRQKRYTTNNLVWNTCNLTWGFRDPFRLFKSDDQFFAAKDTIKEALHHWQESAGGLFTLLDLSPSNRLAPENAIRRAQIDILFAKLDHGDQESFDGPGGLVAHSGYPLDGIVHFDASEQWTISNNSLSDDYVDLRYVALHEIGHALGLRHSAVPVSIMNPFYNSKVTLNLLSEDDVDGIKELFAHCLK